MRPSRRSPVAIGLIAVLALLAQPSLGDGEREERWEFEAVGGIDVEDFLDILTAETGVTLVYDRQTPEIRYRRLNLEGRVEIRREQIFTWGRAALASQGIALVPVLPSESRTFVVLNRYHPRVGQRPVFVPEGRLAGWSENDGAYITTTVTMRHMSDLPQCRAAVAQMMTGGVGRAVDVPELRMVVLTDFAPVVVGMERVLRALDATAAAATSRPPARTRQEPDAKTLSVLEHRLAAANTDAAAQLLLTEILTLRTKAESRPGNAR